MLPELSDVVPSREWLDAWTGYELDMLSRGLSKATIKVRQSTVLIMARWATLHHHEPSQITKQQMQRYLLKQYADRKGVGASVLYSDLRSFWAWYSAEFEVASPMASIQRPKGKSAPVHVLSPAEIAKVLAACSTPRDQALIRLMLSSGLRRTEVCSLDVEDVDLKQRTIMVKRGKGGKARVAVMDDEAAKALWRLLRTRPEGSVALFEGRSGTRMTPGSLNHAVTRIAGRSGIPLHPHQLRHTWAHYALSGGIGERNLMQLAGWSNPAMLARYGAALASERAVEAGRQVQVSQVIRSRKA